jgi:flagellar motor switch protein FliN
MPDTPEASGQDDVARLLAEAQKPAEGAIDQGSIDALLNQAQSALSSIDEPSAELPAGVTPFAFKDLTGASPANETASLDLLRDVQLDLKIELGRTQMHLEDVLRLKQGAVVTLDKLAGDPVDIYANGRLIARGEVLVLNDNFCVRVAELIASDDAAA